MILKKVITVLFLATAITMPLIAETQTPDDNEALKQEVQKLREEVKALNDILPIRGDSTWGTGLMFGVNWGGAGSKHCNGAELGYSFTPRWGIKADIEQYLSPEDTTNGGSPYSYSLGFSARTSLSVNLRGYFTFSIGAAKIPDAKTIGITKGVMGIEWLSNKHIGLFMEIGNMVTFSEDKKYTTKISNPLAIAGVRFYL
jgi:hypothetical protein